MISFLQLFELFCKMYRILKILNCGTRIAILINSIVVFYLIKDLSLPVSMLVKDDIKGNWTICLSLKPTAKAQRLCSGKLKIDPLGAANITCLVQNNSECLKFHIVYTDQTALLSAKVCKDLRLLTV